MEFCELTLADYIGGNREVVTNMINSTFIERSKMDMGAKRWHGFCVIMKDVINGLVFLHSCDMVHRDLKPTNSW
jgi:hypothetical protein